MTVKKPVAMPRGAGPRAEATICSPSDREKSSLPTTGANVLLSSEKPTMATRGRRASLGRASTAASSDPTSTRVRAHSHSSFSRSGTGSANMCAASPFQSAPVAVGAVVAAPGSVPWEGGGWWWRAPVCTGALSAAWVGRRSRWRGEGSRWPTRRPSRAKGLGSAAAGEVRGAMRWQRGSSMTRAGGGRAGAGEHFTSGTDVVSDF